MRPPKGGPTAWPTPLAPAQAPIARAPRPAGYTWERTPITVGGIAAQARPWTARIAMSTGSDGASAAPTSAADISASAATSTRLRPIRSPTQPLTVIPAASTIT